MVETYSRKIEIESVINFRDLGGYKNRDGREVAWRRIFRSGDFRNITDSDFDRIEREIGLTSVIDLRTSEETEAQGKWRFADFGIHHYHIPFPGGGGNRKEEQEWFKQCTNLGEFYLHLVSREEFSRQIVAALNIIADPVNHPLVFHCAIGKDRTGILSAILLSILGIDDKVIIEDYTLSGPAVARLRKTWSQDPSHGDFVKHMPGYFWEAAPASMKLFLSTLQKEHGSVVNYIQNMGVQPALINSIRETLLI
jgi:protein-tyrosine phosphatase